VVRGDEYVFAALGLLPLKDSKTESLGGEVKRCPKMFGLCGRKKTFSLFLDFVLLEQLRQSRM